MSYFEEIKQKIPDAESLSRLSADAVNSLREEFPGLAQDYVDFLSIVGYGDLGELQVYSGPILAEEVYESATQELRSIILFADDFQGYCFGFDTADEFRVVEVDPRGRVDRSVEPDFRMFIAALLSE